MTSAYINSKALGTGATSLSWKRTALVVGAASLMIISDCMSLFGQSVFGLKYIALVLIAIISIYSATRTQVHKVKFVPAILGLTVLIVCIPFQTGSFSAFQSIGLYLLIFVFAVFSDALLRTSDELRIIGIACSLAVIILLVLSFNDCLSQVNSSLASGRLRMRGCFSHPNSLGNTSALISVMLIIGFFLGKTKHKIDAILYILMIVVVLLSGSRTALIMAVTFALFFAYFTGREKLKKSSTRTFVSLVFLLAVLAVIGSSIQYLTDDTTFMLRLRSLENVTFGGVQSLVGLGYVSSGDADQVVSAAGGATEMILVSMYYRVGLLGIIAYILLYAGALRCGRVPVDKRDKAVLLAFLSALIMQSMGESYLSSVMTFVSCFEWILMTSLSMGLSPSNKSIVISGRSNGARMNRVS